MSDVHPRADRDIPRWLPLALLALVILVLYRAIFTGETLFWGLPTLQFYPWREFAFAELRAGRLPAWNPYLGAGAPLLANQQTAIFYPPNWLLLALPILFGMSLIALLHMFWAGLGMWFFTGALGFSAFGQGTSTLSYALCGYIVARLGSFPTADAAAWIPWVFWLVHRTLAYRRWRDAGGLALVFGLQLLAGHAQTTWYGGLGAGLYALWHVFVGGQGIRWQARVRGMALAGAGMALGLALAAVQIVPTVEYLRHSNRSNGLDYETLTNLSYHPARLLTLLAPDFFGTPADGSYFTEGIYFEDAAYVGLIPLIAAGAACIAWWRHRKTKPRDRITGSVGFWVGLAILALVFAAGKYGPYFRFLYDHVPTFNAFREPVRWLILTDFALAVLAGIGVEHWGRGPRIVFWSRLAAAGGGGLAVMTLGARAFADLAMPELDTIALAVALLGCWITVAALLTLVQPRSPATTTPRRLWRVTVLIVVALDLAWMAGGLNPTVDADFFDRQAITPSPGRIYWFDDYEHVVTFGSEDGESPQIEGYFDVGDYRVARARKDELRASLLPNINMIDRVPALDNNDPLSSGVHSQVIALIEELGPQAGRLLRAAGVATAYGVTPEGWTGANPATAPNPDLIHRAWAVPEAQWVASDEDAVAALRDTAWDPAHTVILSGTPRPTTGSPRLTHGAVAVLSERPAERRYRVRTNGTGYLVIAETWYPGWSVSVNGTPATLHRANLAFMAVAVPEGTSEIVLHYRINHFAVGALLSAGALLVALACIMIRR